MENVYEKMLEFFEQVKSFSKLPKKTILKIAYLRFEEGKSLSGIARELSIGKGRVVRLFNLKSAEKLRQKKKMLYLLNPRKPLTDEQKIKKNSQQRERYKHVLATPSLKVKEDRRRERKNIKWRAKTALIKEVFKNPNKHQRQIWNGIGRWSRKYEQCVECNTTLYRHNGLGLCYVCYTHLQLPSNPSYRKSEQKRNKDYYKLRNERRKNKFQKAMELIKKGEIEVDSKINNILNNLNIK